MRLDLRKSLMQLLSAEKWTGVLESVDTVLFDCDGVLWHGDTLILGSDTVINRLKEMGKRVALVTNNSTKSRAQYLKKCQGLGLNINSKNEVITTSSVCASYLNTKALDGKVYAIGMDGLKNEFQELGIECIGIGVDHFDAYGQSNPAMLYKVPLDPAVRAVVVGLDGHFSYPKLVKAASYLRDPNCLFVATNDDASIPSPENDVSMPGTGILVHSVAMAAGRQPVVLGKPNQPMWEYIQRTFHVKPERTLMVGDRCNTDIKFANLNGLRSLCVFTGDSSMQQLETYASEGKTEYLPEFYLDSIGTIANYFQQ